MSRAANVLSLQALKDFRVAMANFGEEARNSLGGVDMELRRMRDWLERDQLGYWQMQIKRRSQDLQQARADLHRRQLSQQGSDAVSDADQKEAVREAQKRLRIAEEKLALVKRLIPQLQHAIDEYHSHSQPLGDHISGGFEKSMATLEKMILAIESYLALKAPTAPVFETPPRAGPLRRGPRAARASRPPRRPPKKLLQAARPGPSPQAKRRAGFRRGSTPCFRENVMSAHSGRLQHALKHLREQWDITQETWNDPVSRDFERIHLVPLEQLTKGAITGMEKVSEVLGKIRAQCKED